jgi:hypothetical protein
MHDLDAGCALRRLVLGVGLLEHFCGYFGLWLVASRRLALPYLGVVCLTVMAFNGSNWVDTACIATNVRNFPAHRGNVVGAHGFLSTAPLRISLLSRSCTTVFAAMQLVHATAHLGQLALPWN